MFRRRGLRRRIFPSLICITLLAACSSAQKRAQEALEKGDYHAAAQGFESVLAREPDNVEARTGLTEARARILDGGLIDVRKARQTGNPAQAAEQLLQILGWESNWKQLPRAAAVFTQQEELQFVRGFALGELRKGIDGAKPFAAELVFRKYSPFFQDAKTSEFRSLQERNRQLGVNQCKAFAQESYSGLPYGLAFARRVCAFWGENPSFKGESAAPLGAGLIREFRIDGAVQGLPPEIVAEVSPSVQRALQASPWHSATGTETPVITLAGDFKFDQNRTAIQLVHSYTEPEEYIDMELVTKSRNVAYETVEQVLNPLTSQYETKSVLKNRMETYQESAPVRKTRYVSKSYPYGAWQIRQAIQVDWRASTSVASRPVQVAVADHLESQDTQNDFENSAIGLRRKEAQLPDRYQWLRQKREKLVADLATQLNSSWQDLYCAEAPTGNFAHSANQAWRCLRLASAHASPPASIEEWHRRVFGLGTAELVSLLPAGR